MTCSARSVSSTGISLLKFIKLCAVSNVLSGVCKIGKPCLIAAWQKSRIWPLGAWCSVNSRPARGLPLLLAKLLASKTSIRSEALIINSPATNLSSSCSILAAIRLLCRTRRCKASPWLIHSACKLAAKSDMRGTLSVLLNGTRPITGNCAVPIWA